MTTTSILWCVGWYLLMVPISAAATADGLWCENPSRPRLLFYGVCGLLWPVTFIFVLLPVALGSFGHSWAVWAKRQRESL